MDTLKILYATRAFESPHTEGGFLLLRDLATRAADDHDVAAAFFSSEKVDRTVCGIRLIPGLKRVGWDLPLAIRFSQLVTVHSADFDVVQSAHVPTSLNTKVFRVIRRVRQKCGTRFVQTVTALPDRRQLCKQLFWGDAVACINPEITDIVSKFHPNVRTIAPVPAQVRLTVREPAPPDFEEKISGKQVVCFPIDVARVSRSFNLEAVCRALLVHDRDIYLVFPCRFGQEGEVESRLSRILNLYSDRMAILGSLRWILGLLSKCDVVVYPISEVSGKFNPPLVLLEAAALGRSIVTSANVYSDGVIARSSVTKLESNTTASWVEAILGMLNSSGYSSNLEISFDDSYFRYMRMYRELQ